MSFESDYQDLLIKQYWEKPKAKAEIGLQAETWKKVFEFLQSFETEFDLDTAYGDRLDIIGDIVGISRIVPEALAKLYFGFSDNADARGFSSKFDPSRIGAPFSSKFDPSYSSLVLNDTDYRFFIRAKIAKNTGSGYLIDDVGISIQTVISFLFDGMAWVVDNKNMSLTLKIPLSFDLEKLRIVNNLNLLPKPQGVRYLYKQAQIGDIFGFSNNPNSKGFSSKFDPTRQGGKFSRKIIF